jgi:histidine triad (HIT) family protein
MMLAFEDLNPCSPQHVLLIPKKHLDSLNDVSEEDHRVLGHIMMKVSEIAKTLGINESGYRLVSNCGDEGGQTVGHLHFHLVGGRQFQWPPG